MKVPKEYMNESQTNSVRKLKDTLNAQNSSGGSRNINRIVILGHPDDDNVYLRYDFTELGLQNGVNIGREYICFNDNGVKIDCGFENREDEVHFHREMFEIEQ